MPSIVKGVTELYESVSRPVAFAVARRMMEYLQIDSNIPVYCVGRGDTLAVVNSTMKEEDTTRLQGMSQVEITFSEEFSDAHLMADSAQTAGTPLIFNDPLLGICMRAFYYKIRAKQTFKYKSNDYGTMVEFLARAKYALSHGIVGQHVAINYHYPVPPTFMHALKILYDMRERIDGYNESYPKWVFDHFVENATVATNQAGAGEQIVIKDTYTGIYAGISFDQKLVQAESKESNGPYIVEFEIEYWYDRPDNVHLFYPLTVHNQMVPAALLPTVRADEVNDYFSSTTGGSAPTRYSNRFSRSPINYVPEAEGVINIPYFDEWLPIYTVNEPVHHVDQVRMLIQVMDNEPTYVNHLDDFGAWNFPASAIRYMKIRPPALTKLYDSLLYVELHEFYQPLPASEITVDATLKVSTTAPMSKRKYYHLVVKLLLDITRLSPEGLKDLEKDGEFFNDYIRVINPRVPPIPVNPDGSGNPWDIRDKIKEVAETTRPIRGLPTHPVYTVGHYSIVTWRA